MIVFKGDLSKESIKFISVKIKKRTTIVLLIINLFLFLFFLALLNQKDAIGLFIRVIFIFSISVLTICILFVPAEMYNEKQIPNTIKIEKNKIICDGKSEYVYKEREFIDLKYIVDYGNFYFFKFYFFPITPPTYVAQKNLMVEGTIEEFEKLMEENEIPIIKKNKK